MATPEIYENCHYAHNDPHRCKIKLENFHYDILCCLGVIKESLRGESPDEIGLRHVLIKFIKIDQSGGLLLLFLIEMS